MNQQRQSKDQGLTENFYYDNVYRLTSSTLNGTTNISATYDLLGNITSRSDVGSYNYTTAQSGCTYYSNPQLYAVRKAGNTVYCYDKNGNATQIGSGNSITWTSLNQPSVIHNNGNATQLFYDANHQRWKQIATYGTGTETTIYIGGLMEKTTNIVTGTTDYKHYIPVGDTTVEYIRRSSGANNTYYATSDHLGSSDFVTCGSDVSGCSAGTVLVHESFNAFGSRRGGSWSGSPTSADMNNIASTTRTGFTGQEMIDNLNLVNMNGRVYNPAIGRFISADPHVTDPTNPQNFNRYSYVLNNPLSYTDPTGFDDTKCQVNKKPHRIHVAVIRRSRATRMVAVMEVALVMGIKIRIATIMIKEIITIRAIMELAIMRTITTRIPSRT
ncbi:MAG TPA: RHS repeat-associated core domain-containing protein [Steroidobacteraceae bacterium]|nr:RHS repeat-associated core domain-containing protein [Steroidobacteraceae bacterium]